jgi:hypothetical protein
MWRGFRRRHDDDHRFGADGHDDVTRFDHNSSNDDDHRYFRDHNRCSWGNLDHRLCQP